MLRLRRQNMGKRQYKHRGYNESGQSLILIAFSIFALLGFVGLAIDLGLSYVDRVRARRAADAAALAAASELPLETAAHVRALEYLEANGYPCGLIVEIINGNLTYSCTNAETRVEVNSGYQESYISGPEPEVAQRIIRINTVPYRDNVWASNSANRIEVNVQQVSSLYFMRIFGMDSVKVNGRAVGENINNLDVVLIYDTSGSMEFDTLCYGCWSPKSGEAYPEGYRWRLPWKGPPTGPPEHCSGSTPYTYSNQKYIIIEAEEYSYSNVPYDRDGYTQGMTYWVMQRNGGQAAWWQRRTWTNSNALGRDSYGAYIKHMPYYGNDGGGNNCTLNALTTKGGICNDNAWVLARGGPFPAPRVDYEFTVPTTGMWYVWLRGQGGMVMWGLNNNTPGSTSGFSGASTQYDGINPGNWTWIRLGSGTLTANSTHTLHLWAGTSGFSADRIVITTNSSSGSQSDPVPPNAIRNDTAHIDNNRTGLACDPCDARFGGYPGGPGYNAAPHCVLPGFPENAAQNYRYLDDIYDDEQPMRGAVEAAKRFVSRMDPAYDQIGLVSYSSSVTTEDELQCLRRLGAAKCTPSVITDTVIASLDNLHANGSTAIPGAMRRGIEVLSNTGKHYGRPGAAHIMILMTDGEANSLAGAEQGVCNADPNLWPQDSEPAKDCMVYYARQARNNGIVIYSITLGKSADIEVMMYVAELTGGVHRQADSPEDLDTIFDELYNRIFLRLVE